MVLHDLVMNGKVQGFRWNLDNFSAQELAEARNFSEQFEVSTQLQNSLIIDWHRESLSIVGEIPQSERSNWHQDELHKHESVYTSYVSCLDEEKQDNLCLNLRGITGGFGQSVAHLG